MQETPYEATGSGASTEPHLWIPRRAQAADLIHRYLEKWRPAVLTHAGIGRALGLKRHTVKKLLAKRRRKKGKPKKESPASFARGNAPIPAWILPMHVSVPAKVLAGWIERTQERTGRTRLADCAAELRWPLVRARRAYRALKREKLVREESESIAGRLRYLRVWNRPGGQNRSPEMATSDPRSGHKRPPEPGAGRVPYVADGQTRPPEVATSDPRNGQTRPLGVATSDPREWPQATPVLAKTDPRCTTSDTSDTSDTSTTTTADPGAVASPPGGGGGVLPPGKWSQRAAICRLLDAAGVLLVPARRTQALARLRRLRVTPAQLEALLERAEMPRRPHNRAAVLSWILFEGELEPALASVAAAMRIDQLAQERAEQQRRLSAQLEQNFEHEREARAQAGKRRPSFREFLAGYQQGKGKQ